MSTQFLKFEGSLSRFITKSEGNMINLSHKFEGNFNIFGRKIEENRTITNYELRITNYELDACAPSGAGDAKRPTAPYRAHAKRAGRAIGQKLSLLPAGR